MFEPIARTEPIPSDPAIYSGVSVQLSEPAARFSLRARDLQLLARILDRKIPERIGESIGGIACLGPDELYARLPAGTALSSGDGQPVSITEISERALGIVVEGAHAIETLSAGCPLDLSGFSIGQTKRTIFETVEIIVSREAETRFHVEVWRSFAPWLWQALCTAARE